jgi:hypothetical protein
VGVAPDTDLGQVHEGDVAIMAVHDIPPPLGRLSGLPVAVPEDERKLSGTYRDLIEDIGWSMNSDTKQG